MLKLSPPVSPRNRIIVQNAVFLQDRARGLVVMIVACQVMDPGSIPGERIFCRFLTLRIWLFANWRFWPDANWTILGPQTGQFWTFEPTQIWNLDPCLIFWRRKMGFVPPQFCKFDILTHTSFFWPRKIGFDPRNLDSFDVWDNWTFWTANLMVWPPQFSVLFRFVWLSEEGLDQKCLIVFQVTATRHTWWEVFPMCQRLMLSLWVVKSWNKGGKKNGRAGVWSDGARPVAANSPKH